MRDSLDDGQAKSGAAKASSRRDIGLLESGEKPFLLFGGDADAGIRHRELDPVLAGEPQGEDLEPDPPAVGELGRVAEQIEQ